MTYDAANPGLEGEDSSGAASSPGFQGSAAGGPFTAGLIAGPFFEPFFYADSSNGTIPINYNGTNFRQNASIGVLLVHMHNGAGNRSDVVLFRKPTITSFSPSHGKAGTLVTIQGTNFNSGTAVTFNNKPAAAVNVLSSTTLVATVPNGATTGRIRVSNPAGTSTSTTNFAVP
jgi:hypothetical protein